MEKLKKEIILILTFYIVMGILQYVTSAIDIGRWLGLSWVFLNYVLKALLTIPLLWFYFKKLNEYPIWKIGLLHLFTMPLFVYVWIVIYYALCDNFGLFRLRGSREVWDVYLTLLFYSIQFGFFHLYMYSKKLKKQELLSAELSKLNAQSELSALKAQLNPHFLYNVFNTINSAIPATAKNARNMVNELSDLFRYQLKASREDMVTVREELEFAQKYLDLEKERFGERLQYEIEIEKGLEDVLIPPMIIQPLVENSIKHGISPQIKGGLIKVGVTRLSENLHFTICDTGKGIDGQKHSQLLNKGVGLSNTNERLIKLYGKGLELKNNLPSGLCVSFSIPIHTELEQQ